MTIVLTGANHYLLKAELDKLTTDFKREHGDIALEILDGEEDTYETIIGAVESLPFLAAKKMVVVRSLSANKLAAERLDQLVELSGETTDLVIVEQGVDKRSAYYKSIKKLPGFHEFRDLDENGLSEWLVKEAGARDGSISRADARFIVERVGQNQMRLSREVEKLVNYNKNVTRESIELLTEENPSSTIFNLVDSAFSGNLAEALKIYDEQRKQRVEPQAIHGMLVWQMHAVAVTSAAPRDASPAQISKDSGLSPYVIQKSQRIARKMGRQKISEFMELLRDIDYRGKHEALDFDEAVRFAIVTLAD